MAHNGPYDGVAVPVLPGAGFVPTPGFIRWLDKTTSESVNGGAGGLWAPKTPIIIGQSGVTIGDAGGFTGGVTTGRRALPGALHLGDSDWPSHAARTRTVLFPIEDILNAYSDTNRTTANQPIYEQLAPGSFAGADQSLTFYVPLDMKKFPPGATIASVTARFRVGARPTSIPSPTPRIYFECDTLSDNAFLPTPATVDAYHNAGLPQDLTVVPVNNATVTAGANYRVHIVDPTLTSNVYHSIAIAFTNLITMQPGL